MAMFKIHYSLIFLVFSVLNAQTEVDEAAQLIDQKQYVQAQHKMKTFLERHPNNLDAVELLGDAYAYQRLWDNAIEKYEYLLAQQSESATYNYKYGGALAMKAQSVNKLSALGLIGDIKRAFLKTIELDSTHINAHWALVDYYVTLPGIVGGSFSKALDYANKLEAISTVDGYLAKGYVYEYDDEPILAEKFYKLAIKEGGSLTCYSKLSDFYSSQNRPQEAISNFERAKLKLNRNALHYQIGKVCADYNIQLDKGEKCLNTYIENFTAKDGVPLEWAYLRLAQIYKHKGSKSEALKYIDKALGRNEDFKQAIKEKEFILKM